MDIFPILLMLQSARKLIMKTILVVWTDDTIKGISMMYSHPCQTMLEEVARTSKGVNQSIPGDV